MSTEKSGFYDFKTKFPSHQSFETPLNLITVLNANMRNVLIMRALMLILSDMSPKKVTL